MEKQATRQKLLQQRKQLDENTSVELSLRIQRQVLAADCFSHAETLALYSPINNEVRTQTLLTEARSAGKQVCFPRVNGESLQFVAVESNSQLQPGAFGVAEPRDGKILAPEAIDLLVVPGVAFDREGYRLGYGKGFYDRELARMAGATVSVGLCYEFQLCERLPVEEHDQQLDFVATETQFIPATKR
jgi:5-formyltetrahydrofolate cyclo-ligase